MKQLFATLCFLSFFFFAFASNATEKEVVAPEEYLTWLEELKSEMLKKEISQATIDKAFAKNYYKPEVIEYDRKQPEFIWTTTDYLNRIVSEKRVKSAREKYKEYHTTFIGIEEKYGVPLNYLIAFWGAETNFGASFGNFEIIGALTTLSYDQRRSAFFKNELYEALKIMETQDVSVETMQGSWAGAMGNFQFMPSTFNNYAVDYDGDGKIDIWTNLGDSFASAANYLAKLGWKKDEPWGMEVTLGDKFNFEDTGLSNIKTIKYWKSKDVKDANGKAIKLNGDVKASIIIPEGRKGKAYLVLNNFRKILVWNRSENYALAICQLADYAVSHKKWQAEEQNLTTILKTEDILTVQEFINAQKIATIDVDGKFGTKTKEAIKALQKQAKLPQDGYPDYHLLLKIKRYNPDIGFIIPLQPKKIRK